MPDINDLIEIIRNVDDSPASECGFDMMNDSSFREVSSHPCGTACCIGGHAAIALGRPDVGPASAVLSFGVRDHYDASKICFPDVGLVHPVWSAKPHHAVRLLENYRDTGEVDWDLAMREPGEIA